MIHIYCKSTGMSSSYGLKGNLQYKILPEISSKNRQEIGEINRRDKGEMKHHCFGENLGKSRVSGSGSSIMEVRFRVGAVMTSSIPLHAFFSLITLRKSERCAGEI